jgi:hypothetical protein
MASGEKYLGHTVRAASTSVRDGRSTEPLEKKLKIPEVSVA